MTGEIIVDSFAGGGGTSEGIRQAIGRDPDIAINHDALALAMHRLNHPGTLHMVEDVWNIDIRTMCDNKPVGLLWMSPDCKHFSKAKGGKPREKAIRGLAWVGVRWVKSLPKRQRPRVIILENVEEFQDWGPLLEDGRPCPAQKGVTFKAFIGSFEAMGYRAKWWELRACDYGDPTIRKRLFVVMRRDGKPIVRPPRTHGNPKDIADAKLIAEGKLQPWRTAAEIIDWSLPCPSIFETAAEIKAKWGLRAVRPLKPATLARVAKGTKRYVLDAAEPFIVPITHGGDVRVHPIDEPLRTITTANRGEHALLTPFVTKFNSGATGHAVDQPLATVTSHASETHGGGAAPLGVVSPVLIGCGGRAGQSQPRPGDDPILTQTAKADGNGDPTRPLKTVLTGQHAAAIYAFLAKYYGDGLPSQSVAEPLHTVTAKPRHGLVTVSIHGEPFVIVDIGMRMLTPRERFSAQGFGSGYVIDRGQLEDGSVITLTLEQQGRMCGNSVCPGMARALVAANYDPRIDVHIPAPAETPLLAAAE